MATAKPDYSTFTKNELYELAKTSTDAALFEHLRKFNLDEEKAKSARKETIDKLIAEMAKSEITIYDLFSKSAISAAAKKNEKTVGGAPKNTENESKEVLIKVIGGGKRPPVFQKGDVLGSYSKPAFKALSKEHGAKFAEKLKEFYTPAGTEYFATPEGKTELEAFIKHTQEKPDGAVKKKTPAAKKA